jgi:glutamate-5-semialdehyde dehydrogenase
VSGTGTDATETRRDGETTVSERVRAAKAAGQKLAARSGDERSALLRAVADALESADVQASVLAANSEDVAAARAETERGALQPVLLQRLGLDAGKLSGLAVALRQLADQPDRVGSVTLRRELDQGLVLERVACPLGVLGVVFESRPDALVQIAGLALRSGNAVVMKGGREALRTNRALTAALQQVLVRHGLDAALVTLLSGREEVQELIGLDQLVDLIVARGSSAFVADVRAHTRIPVMSHASGLCHLYLHASAGPEMAARLAVDAKCTYPAACNSIETLLWDGAAVDALDASIAALEAAGVELRGCEQTRARHPRISAASEADWDTEYGALVLSIRCVSGLDDALAHIAAHGSRHTDAIVAEDKLAAERFLAAVDAASVFWNASPRFADGYRYGLGAEVGISTDKLHARGPVGVDGLLTYRWLLRGQGQRTSDYGSGGRSFTHKDLDHD